MLTVGWNLWQKDQPKNTILYKYTKQNISEAKMWIPDTKQKKTNSENKINQFISKYSLTSKCKNMGFTAKFKGNYTEMTDSAVFEDDKMTPININFTAWTLE